MGGDVLVTLPPDPQPEAQSPSPRGQTSPSPGPQPSRPLPPTGSCGFLLSLAGFFPCLWNHEQKRQEDVQGGPARDA